MGSAVGLDIGTTGVRAVQTSAGERSVSVRRAHAIALPAGIVSDGEVADPAVLTSALRELWRRGKFTTRNARLVVGSHPAVLVRPAEVPYLTQKEDMQAVVRDEATRVMPTTDQVYMDHHVARVQQVTDEAEGTTRAVADIAIATASIPALDGILDCMVAAGLSPASVDVTSFSLARMVAKAASGQDSIDAIIHLGDTTVTFTGVHDGQLIYQLAMNNFAGATLTQEIALALGVSTEEAERLKVSGAREEQGAGVDRVLAAWTTALVRELHEAISDMSQSTGHAVGRVWLSGGSAKLPTLAARLGAEIGHGTKVAVLDAAAWVRSPEKFVGATQRTDQDLTVALSASIA